MPATSTQGRPVKKNLLTFVLRNAADLAMTATIMNDSPERHPPPVWRKEPALVSLMDDFMTRRWRTHATSCLPTSSGMSRSSVVEQFCALASGTLRLPKAPT
jgi:hypothetical protein